jgi:hypothetical protein
MRQKRFLAYLTIQVLVIISVILIFKLMSNVKIASTVAGVLFVVLPMALGGYEWKDHGIQRKSFYFGLLQFWVFFALPILGLRLFNWDAAFADLSVLGVPGPVLHKYANTSYLIMMGLTFTNYLRKK